MPESQKLCSLCLKPKSRKSGGFVTQFIDVCLCDVVPAAPFESIKICQACHKRVDTGRAGSLTQWIFKPSICSCENRHSSDAVQVDITSAEQIDDRLLDGPELPLDASSFPVERYKPVLELGRGGAGSVHLCLDRQLKKKVAVKVLHRLTGEQLLLFQQEARAISRMNHRGIIQILDFGPTESGFPFMVLEYIQGRSLDLVLRNNGPMPPQLALQLFSEVCDALSHAHAANIYHRDLKPNNILLFDTADGAHAKLIDFGVARVKTETQEPTIVQGKTLAGTPAYMAPDQLNDMEYDARSEVYSLGCVLFETLTGHAPFNGDSALEVLNMHSTMAPPTLSDVSDHEFSDELEEIVARCLAKDPDERPASMRELRNLLQEALEVRNDKVEIEASNVSRAGTKKSKVQGSIAAMLVSILVVALLVPIINSIMKPAPMAKMSDLNSEKHLRFVRPIAAVDPMEQPTDLPDEPRSVVDDMGALIPGNTYDAVLENALKGDVEAQNDLGNKYFSGDGIARNYQKAMYWYRKAADQGHDYACVNVGKLYEEGKGVPQDYKAALKWYIKVPGNSKAQYKIGHLYFEGLGVKQNYETALKWLLKGANNDDPGAQEYLGRMYEDGVGVKKDLQQALDWYTKAARSKTKDKANVARVTKALKLKQK